MAQYAPTHTLQRIAVAFLALLGSSHPHPVRSIQTHRWHQVLHPGEVNALVHSYRISVDRSAAPSAVAQRLRLRVEISYIAEGQTTQSLHRATPTHLPPKVS